jgi:hypothetical protein
MGMPRLDAPAPGRFVWAAFCAQCGESGVTLARGPFEHVRRVAHAHSLAFGMHAVACGVTGTTWGASSASAGVADAGDKGPQARPCFSTACADRDHIPVQWMPRG